MNRIFTGDFSVDSLSDWNIEQHVPDGYSDFAVRNNTLVFLDAGNRILPNIPALAGFSIVGNIDADWNINNGEFSVQVFFGYDKYLRQGMCVDFGLAGGKLFAKLLSADKQTITSVEFDAPYMETNEIIFKLERTAVSIRLCINLKEYLHCPLDMDTRGYIALSRGAFLGELRMHSLSIDSPEQLDQEVIYNNLQIPFAPINGMDIPIVWTVNAARYGDAVRVDVELSGGEKSRPNIPWFPYHCHYVEFLEKPYLRIESKKHTADLHITDVTLVLAIPHREYFYIIAHKNPPWPFKKTFYLNNLDKDSILFAGYKCYGNMAVNKHLEALTPYETAYDVRTDRIIYAGAAIAPGTVAIDLKSPKDKQICKAIPPSTQQYEKALKSAELNHYFMPGEDCVFHFELTSRSGSAIDHLRLDYRLENAFFDVITDYQPLPIAEEKEIVGLDIAQIESERFNLGCMAPGVYHIRFRLSCGAKLIHQNYRAFEVLGEKISGAEASRLPVCFSMSNEVKGQDTDNFDPWRADCADVSHYISICAGIMPHFAREKRFWELLKIYKREWFLWLGDRVMQDYSVENNHDLIANCDYIDLFDRDALFRLCARAFYGRQLNEILYGFAIERNFRVDEIKAAVDSGDVLDKETFDAVVSECYYEWVDYFWRIRIKELTEYRAHVNAVNPNAKVSSYGPEPVYGGIYKTAHSSTYVGSYKACAEMEAFRDGYYMLEDYPHACRYSIHSGPFFLSSFKAIAPNIKVYPEMYNETGESVPCPDAAVARAFPSYGMWNGKLAVDVSMKVVLEYVFGCVWHNGREFNYWKDYGFHTRVWEKERFEGLLKLWGFVDKNSPKRPLKANAFVCNEDCCRNHTVLYDEYPGDSHEAFGDLFNTAEECSIYSCEMSRIAGQNAGFVTDFDNLSALTAQDIDILVLPPLTKVGEDALKNIRRLHEQGVPLLAFEEVAGLEDLFGVCESNPTQIHNIQVNSKLPDNPLNALAAYKEYTSHRACVGKYVSTTAQVLLDAEAPVLFTNKTRWGRTALYNLPPTAVKRQDQFNRVGYGRASISQLINKSTQMLFKYLSNPAVETSEGKIIAFEDTNDKRHIVIMEDSHPYPSKPIDPVITLNMQNIDSSKIRCSRDFVVLSESAERVELSVALEPDQYALLSLE